MDSSKGQLEYDAAAYEVYLAGADAEYDAIMVALKEALRCSCVPPRAGLAVLDIGAGNGHLLARMVKELGVTSYVAFEPEQRLAAALSYKVQVRLVVRLDIADPYVLRRRYVLEGAARGSFHGGSTFHRHSASRILHTEYDASRHVL